MPERASRAHLDFIERVRPGARKSPQPPLGKLNMKSLQILSLAALVFFCLWTALLARLKGCSATCWFLGGGILGETRLLGRKTVEAMRTNRMTPEIENRIAELDPNSDGYGFGLTVAVRQRTSTLMGSLGEFYWNGAYGTLWWADPEEDLAVVFMAQVPGLQRRRWRPVVNGLVYQALTE